jgi:hypothetical protein
MRRGQRVRFWVESALSTAAAALCLMTMLWKDWIEIVFGVDPDHHSGSLEWVIALGTLLVAVGSGAAARHEWLRARPATA